MAKHQSSINSTLNVQKQSRKDSPATTHTNMTPTYNIGVTGGAVQRIREPHKHDVLSGRGGGINSHEGNIQFRKWVSVRKNEYNLANNKVAKASIAREVIALVQNQSPPGRFLQKDPSSLGSSTWWIELDDEKMIAKTSQALREGAPKIRAAHKEVLSKGSSRRARTAPTPTPKKRPIAEVSPEYRPTTIDHPRVFNQLLDNVPSIRNPSQDVVTPEKRARVEYEANPEDSTPPLVTIPTPDLTAMESTMLPPPAVIQDKGFRRTNSLALSDISVDNEFNPGFVNPFDNDGEWDMVKLTASAPRLGVLRQSSVASDMGGFGALFKSSETLPSLPSWTSFGKADKIKSTGSVSDVSEISYQEGPLSLKDDPNQREVFEELMQAYRQ